MYRSIEVPALVNELHLQGSQKVQNVSALGVGGEGGPQAMQGQDEGMFETGLRGTHPS